MRTPAIRSAGTWLAAGLACALPLLAAAHGSEEAHAREGHAEAVTMPATAPVAVPVTAKPAPGVDPAADEKARAYFTDLPLVDQNGRAQRFYTDVLRGRTVLIDFIYTNCENACPMSTAKLNQVRQALGERFGRDVTFISLSVDPVRDTPQAMREFARKLEADVPGWLFLTGEQKDVNTIVRKLGQYTEDPTEHSMLMIAGNVATAHWTKIAPMATIPQIVLKLESLALDL